MTGFLNSNQPTRTPSPTSVTSSPTRAPTRYFGQQTLSTSQVAASAWFGMDAAMSKTGAYLAVGAPFEQYTYNSSVSGGMCGDCD
jgi:hypothetical protein